jgi:hypothetical protein
MPGFSREECLGPPVAETQSRVYHNVCVDNGIGILFFRGGCRDNIVRNNIFACNGTGCGYDNGGGAYGDPADNVLDHNCYVPGTPDAQLTAGPQELTSDPLFRDREKGSL